MNGYLTRLAAKNLHRTETIGPRPVSRYEPRGTAALPGEELGRRDATAADPSRDYDLRHASLEREVPYRYPDSKNEASAAVGPAVGPMLRPAFESPDGGAFTAGMNQDTSKFTSRPDPVAGGLHIRPPLVLEEQLRPNQPVASRHPRKAGMGPTPGSDRNGSDGSVNVDKESRDGGLDRSRQSRHTDIDKLQVGQEHRSGKAGMTVSYSRIIPSMGLPTSEQRTVAGPTVSQRPVIKVSIGRIDVRAIMPAPPAPKARREQPGPSQSLHEYLSRRSGGSR